MDKQAKETVKPKESLAARAFKFLLHLFAEMLPYAIVAMPILFGKVFASAFAAVGVALLLIPLWVWLYRKYQDKDKAG